MPVSKKTSDQKCKDSRQEEPVSRKQDLAARAFDRQPFISYLHTWKGTSPQCTAKQSQSKHNTWIL